MKLLLNAAGVPEVRNSKLVLVDDANGNKEIEVDPVAIYETNGRLFGENKTHREQNETLTASLKKFAGIEDPAAAIEALTKVKSLGTKEAEFATKLEEVRNETTKAMELKFAPFVEKAKTLETTLSGMRRSTAFANSEFVKTKLNIPADMAETHFGGRFVEKEGKLLPTDEKGQPLYSMKNPGTYADFEEGLAIIIDGYSHKASILKGTGASGGGTQGGGGTQNGKPTMRREAFEQLSPVDAAAAVKGGTVIVD